MLKKIVLGVDGTTGFIWCGILSFGCALILSCILFNRLPPCEPKVAVAANSTYQQLDP